MTSTNYDYKTKTKYTIEDPDVIIARKALADFHMSQGKSFKYSWWLAFQQFPRDSVPSEAPSTSKAQIHHSKDSTDVHF